MRILNQHLFYVYEKTTSKVDGEPIKGWKYKNKVYLNDQQDINELDATSSGLVDYDTLKLRTNKNLDVIKDNGISYIELKLSNGVVINDTPQYIVKSTSKIGKSLLIVCKTYNGE